MVRNLLLVPIILLVTSCATPISMSSGKVLISSEVITDKNYELNIEISAYVGQPVIKVKDFTLNTFKTDRMKATSDFIIKGPVLYGNNTFKKTQFFNVVGTTVVDDYRYTLIQLPNKNSFQSTRLLIDENGKPQNKLYNLNAPLIYSYSFIPSELEFNFTDEDEIDITNGYTNFEIIYSGSDDNKIYLTYREFTSDNLARPSFFQDLTYSKSSKKIRFRDISIDVIEASNESISFIVRED